MNLRFKHSMLTFLSIYIIVVTLSACTIEGGNTARLPTKTPSGQNVVKKNVRKNNVNIITPLPTGNIPQNKILGFQMSPQIKDYKVKADKIKKQLESMKEVKNAHVMVVGSNALVGFKALSSVGNSGAKKDMIIRKVKEADPSIQNVTVSESPEIMNRVSKLYNDMVNRMKANEVVDEFNKMLRAVSPVSR